MNGRHRIQLAVGLSAVILVMGASLYALGPASSRSTSQRANNLEATSPAPDASASTLSQLPAAATSPLISPSAEGPTLNPLVAAPLTYAKFPTQTVDYPINWPGELHFPSEFQLVETVSGQFQGGRQGWSVSLRYQGTVNETADKLTVFFNSNGWIVTSLNHKSGALLLHLKNNTVSQSGSIIIEPDGSDQDGTKILAVIRM